MSTGDPVFQLRFKYSRANYTVEAIEGGGASAADACPIEDHTESCRRENGEIHDIETELRVSYYEQKTSRGRIWCTDKMMYK